MASASYYDDLTCPICLSIFTDPVTLLCGHSFCKRCITDVLAARPSCPQCRTDVPTEVDSLPTSHILRSLAEKAKEEQKEKKQKAEMAELCPEHEEKLKLFCITDQRLACIICRDGEKHEGHKFKPVKEAAASLRKELEERMENLGGDILTIESLANTQREEITKTKEKSRQLMTQICRQFEEMHQFLRRRGDEIKNELRVKETDAVEKMRERSNAIEAALSESRELEGKLTEVLETEESERLLKSWTECKSSTSPEGLCRPRADDLQVVHTSLSLGPYESHLQFFIWKEMLQVIQPRAELLSLKSNSTDITVSGDGRSLFSTPERKQASSDQSFGFGTGLAQDRDYNQGLYGRAQVLHSIFGQPKAGGFGTAQATGFSFGQTRSSDISGFGNAQATGFSFGASTDSGLNRGFVQPSSSSNTHAFSVNEFTSGQHYWETEVGHRDYWELGIQDHFLKYDGLKYSTCSSDIITELEFADRPRKIGIYLNCESKTLSFYDADNMKRIHALSSRNMSKSLSAYFTIRTRTPDSNPMMVCWY